ncbi:hypothetical protein LDO31_03130 [Luteimonas sp. XNQY3]|nr:hypothetical protein [Luteimonas sp. XNQY3]MCD9005241.1 hypothetical protein [Luteimonas sp. XNQY3]
MPAGLEAWDAQGRIVVDLTDRLTQYLGEAVVTAGVNGSVSVPQTGAGNSVWAAFISGSVIDRSRVTPAFSVSGNTISWAWPANLAGSGLIAVGGVVKFGRY